MKSLIGAVLALILLWVNVWPSTAFIGKLSSSSIEIPVSPSSARLSWV
jgi:hypothetical protein